ncbi:MAG: hypothetical protein OXU28_13070 [Chloroflexota bacterium]|nr:hypothetical protein [Chloroflexota bacterium]
MMTQPSASSLRDMMNAVEQSPDLQEELRQWVLRLIRGSDGLREELRREILTEELLRLPARFTKMEQDVGVLKDDVEVLKDDVRTLKEDVAGLKDGQARIEQYVADLRTGLAQVSGQIGRLSGNEYQAWAIERSRRLIRRLHRMEMGTVLHSGRPPSPTFDAEILIPAIRSGRITRDEADDLEDADCILRLEDPEQETIYAVVEISITVQETDRVRAARRAEIFSRAIEIEALPYVVGEQEEPPGDASPRVTFVEYPAEFPPVL